MTVSTIGLDIAKQSFHVSALDEQDKEVSRKRLGRASVVDYFARLEAPVLVGIETCGGAHHWARELSALGHQVKLMSPKAAKAYRSRTKNDLNDARAIAEAATREQVRSIPMKSTSQQDLQALHRVRRLAKKQRDQQASQIRGLLGEYGLVLPLGVSRVIEQVPALLEDAENGLSMAFRELLSELYERLCAHQARLLAYDKRIERAQASDPIARRAAEVPGVGPLTSTAVAALHGDLRQFRCGRDFGAALGLVPRQASTGGRTVLLGINKHTDPYLRTLYIHGARALLSHAARYPDDPLRQWALRVSERRGRNIATVALANKLARITWAVLARDQHYCPDKLRTIAD